MVGNDLRIRRVTRPGRRGARTCCRPISDGQSATSSRRLTSNLETLIREVIESGQPRDDRGLATSKAAGTHCGFTRTASPAERYNGGVIVMVDIDPHKRAEESLREADRRKDEFLATLAHELRNPLAPIRNAVEILRLAAADSTLAVQAREVLFATSEPDVQDRGGSDRRQPNRRKESRVESEPSRSGTTPSTPPSRRAVPTSNHAGTK